jgi:hypothetical protein
LLKYNLLLKRHYEIQFLEQLSHFYGIDLIAYELLIIE